MQELAENDANTEEISKPELDVNALLARMEKMEQTNARLLEESKTHKGKYQGLRNEVEDERKAVLTENENWKELLEIEKNKRSGYEVELKETKKAVLQKELNFKVASLAKDAYDVTDIIGALPKDMISIDEDTLSINGVEEALNFVREKKPYFFNTETRSGMTASRPAVDLSSADEELTNDEELKKALEGIF